MPRFLFLLVSTLSFFTFWAASSANATILSATATPFAGAPLQVDVTIDDDAPGVDAGDLEITLQVTGGDIGDLRGFFAHVANESLLDGLSVISNTDVTGSEFDANNVISVGGGNNLNGGNSPCDCDLGIEFGSPGIGRNDIQSVTFILTHATQSLDVSLFSEQAFGVRATSVGPIGGSREGSSKLSGEFPFVVPEPSTAFLMLLGLAGLTSVGPRKASTAD